MLDITRGPHMHSEQYAGVAWLSVPLEPEGRVYIFGAGEVPLWTARLAKQVGFATTVLDDDGDYLSEQRFAHSQRVLLSSFAKLPELGISEPDYVLVLTRGHMHDPEALVYAIQAGAHYVGMMGCASKNARVFELARDKGISQEQLEATHSPIGLKFGAKTPPELAISIVAELIQDRYCRRKS
jgi:xanthine dehydrogenase accessory factor